MICKTNSTLVWSAFAKGKPCEAQLWETVIKISIGCGVEGEVKYYLVLPGLIEARAASNI